MSASTVTLQTLLDHIRYATSRMNAAEVFFGHGTDNAWDEAVALVLQSLHLPPDLPSMAWQARLLPEESELILARLAQRVEERLPLPYITGQSWFMGLEFAVDQRVLIPRSPLAETIEQQFQPWIGDPDRVEAILDLGTGSGCIGIACAYAFPDAQITLSDIDDEALAVAAANVAAHGLADQVELVQADVLDGLAPRRFDLIVSNPPYVAMDEYQSLPPEYDHEPQSALAAGEDGLDVVRRLLAQASDYLNADGLLVVEVGNSAEAMAEAFSHLPLTWLAFERGGDGVFILTREQLLSS